MKCFIVAEFSKHLNRQICKYWYILCCTGRGGQKSHINQPTDFSGKIWNRAQCNNWKPAEIPKAIKLGLLTKTGLI